ncbi:hypothetical protein SLA2020_131390 [Shorea laevis]
MLAKSCKVEMKEDFQLNVAQHLHEQQYHALQQQLCLSLPQPHGVLKRKIKSAGSEADNNNGNASVGCKLKR